MTQTRDVNVNFKFLSNHFETDPRPEMFENNRLHREEREEREKNGDGKSVNERFKNKIEFTDFDLFWLGHVPQIQTIKGLVSFTGDLRFFEKELGTLVIDQQGTINYKARRNNFRYSCKVAFVVSDVKEINGRKSIYLFFDQPMITAI